MRMKVLIKEKREKRKKMHPIFKEVKKDLTSKKKKKRK